MEDTNLTVADVQGLVVSSVWFRFHPPGKKETQVCSKPQKLDGCVESTMNLGHGGTHAV